MHRRTSRGGESPTFRCGLNDARAAPYLWIENSRPAAPKKETAVCSTSAVTSSTVSPSPGREEPARRRGAPQRALARAPLRCPERHGRLARREPDAAGELPALRRQGTPHALYRTFARHRTRTPLATVSGPTGRGGRRFRPNAASSTGGADVVQSRARCQSSLAPARGRLSNANGWLWRRSAARRRRYERDVRRSGGAGRENTRQTNGLGRFPSPWDRMPTGRSGSR